MLTFSLLHFLYSRPFFIPYSRCSPGGYIDAWRWSIACLWLMTNWCCIFFYENQWVHIPICFNHLLLQAAVCPAANPPDGNDSKVTVSNLFFTYWHWLNWLPDWEYQTEKRERESHNMGGDDTCLDKCDGMFFSVTAISQGAMDMMALVLVCCGYVCVNHV